MKIGLDIMGGDFAPQATVLGAIAAYKRLRAEAKNWYLSVIKISP
jgi:glycerol-3-phosphate acyltransferase PlsX